MALKAPKAVIFDWDNTLVNTWPVIHAALEATFCEMGLEPWSMAMVKARVARSMRDSFPLIFGDHWEEAGALYQQHFRAIHLARLEALPGAQATLAFLAQKPVYVAVASNKKGVNLRKESDHIGWNGYFSKLIGADDTAQDKPAPDMVFAALSGSMIEKGDEIWFIGDSVIDMECAHNSGCTPLFFGELPAEPLQYAFAEKVNDHQALLALFQKIL